MGEKFRQFLREPTDVCDICGKNKTALLVVSDTESLELCPKHFDKALEVMEEG